MGISFVWAFVLGFGILLFPETPRFGYRQGNVDKAAESISKFYGVGVNYRVVGKQMKEMEEKFQAEEAGGDHPWYEVYTGPRMLYRVLLGMTILALPAIDEC
jgi:SP family sugar:H+ symporter-like MFS transporter